MLSKYFEMKTKTEKFDNDLKWSMGEIKDKKVIIYGANEGFVYLNNKYNFTENLNIVAICDESFDSETNFENIRAIFPTQLAHEDYDVILISNEQPSTIIKYLEGPLAITGKDIRTMFNCDLLNEDVHYEELCEYNFGKHLEKLNKKLKNKTVVVYGAGAYFEAIHKYFDLSKLNIIGIADKRFENHSENEEFLGYKAYSPDELRDLKPDYVLVSVRFFVNIIESLYYETLQGTKIKIKPFVRKPIGVLFKEIFGLK